MTPFPGQTPSVVSLLRWRTETRGTCVAYRFLAGGERETETITWAALDARARSIAAMLQDRLGPGERVLLAYRSGLDFIAAFFGCLYAGVIAVPAPLPAHRRGWPRFTALAKDAGAGLALSPEPLDLPSRTLDELPPPDAWREHRPQPDDVAFLQYTSGSTSAPRGVMVTHANLLHNSRLIRDAFAQDEQSRVVGWLPMHHDMGLIGNVLQPLYSGGECILMTPAAFLQRPLLWLQAISRYRATTSGGPDFAYALCARRIREEEKQGLDLSSWRVAFNGSEPVRHETLERFTAAFAAYGFRAEAFHPCYGLAEATLMVASKRAGTMPVSREVEGRMRVSSGRGEHVEIRNGEICVSGPSVARGYWRRDAETAETFRGGVLHTGDLGVLDEDGELFVTGRIKDLIIIRGRNHYPQDLEQTAEEASPALAAGGGAAFAVESDGTERLVLVHEVERHAMRGDLSGVIDAVRAAVAEAHEIQAHEVVLIRPGTMPKTTSGKVQRRACARAWREGALAVVASSTATDVSDATVAELGYDSLQVVELRDRIEREKGVVLPLERIWDSTLGELDALAPVQRRDAACSAGGDAGVPLELSEGQRSLWFVHRLAPESTAYHVAFALRVKSLDVERLREAFARLVARHDMLRSNFPMHDGRPVRVAACEPRLEIGHGAWEDELHRPFDLERDALVRFRLYGDVLVFVAHHIIVDFWSLAVLMDELRALYAGGTLPPLPATYADFVRWQRTLDGGLLDRWQHILSGELAPLDLPADFPRPAAQTYHGASHRFTIDAATTRELRALMRREGTTLFTTLLTTWFVLLSRYSGQEDLVVGAPAAGRSRADFRDVVGYFANLLPIRARVGGSFGETLARVKAAVGEALALQDVPFPRIVERVRPARDASRSPLFQTVFALEKAHRLSQEGISALALGSGGAKISLGPLQLDSVELPKRAAQFDVTLMCVEAGDRIEAALEYNTDLFAPATVERMARHFVALLRGESLEQEERRLIESWNATERDYPRDATIGELFDEQAALHPDAIAVEMGDERLTYRELAQRAEELAPVILSRVDGEGPPAETSDPRLTGGGPSPYAGLRMTGRFVPLLMDRSIDLIVHMLAAIKAGAAYVPIAPSYPEARIQWMREDVGRASARPVGLKPALRLKPGLRLAYVMYTSGSTGTPKGVMVPHRAVIRLVKGQTYAKMDEGETFLHFAPHTFDAATFEIWGALLNGARLVIQPPGKASLDDLAETIRTKGVTTLWLTAGLFHAFVDERIEALRGVRQLLAGGDVVSAAHVKRVLREGITFINGYGPTEATTFTCCHRVTDPESIGASVPIGKPLANTKVYVLDRNGQPVPIGVPGELCIGGDGLAIGYTNGERFDGLYRTGDRVRWNANGELEFLGRFDDQLKIRGFRIEPGEIEAVLREKVSEAVVVAKDKTLVAYVTPRGIDVRAHLESRLPQHMIPSRIIALDAFPLTPNGKIDRRALPAPELDREAQPAVPPRNEIERLLAKLLTEALGTPSVGIHDNFFDLGAHSLLLARVHARLVSELRRDVPIVDFFTYPTIASLAAHIGSAKPADDFHDVRARAAARRQAMSRRPSRMQEPHE